MKKKIKVGIIIFVCIILAASFFAYKNGAIIRDGRGITAIPGENEEIPSYSGTELMVITDKKEYRQGELIKISLKNNSKENIYSHIGSMTPASCIEFIERKASEGAWEKLFAQCKPPYCYEDIDAPTKIVPGQSITFEWKPSEYINGTSEAHQLTSGEYRLAILYEDHEKIKWEFIYTNEFLIK